VTGRSERGSASIWVMAGTALLLVVALTVTVRGTAILARHRAETAADAAALAAAAQIGVGLDPCAAAATIATANDAQMRSCRLELLNNGRSGRVLVTVTAVVHLPFLGPGTVSASARAQRDPAAAGPQT
jgi:secretion/DNA translocation related TadE-like protein